MPYTTFAVKMQIEDELINGRNTKRDMPADASDKDVDG